jgi:signal transduction histidine kinase
LPLQAAGQASGLIVLGGIGATTLTPRRRRLLDTIADQAAVAISSARFRARVREFAVLEERERIAREMHDGLAQVLGYVNTKAFAIRRLLKDGDSTSAQAMLSQLEEASREVYADVREGVLALRSTAPGERGLLENICDYLGKFERLTGIRVECHADRNVAALRLPEMSEIQVMRVIQEALSNVRKHAGASSASVTLRARDGTLVARVDDDGSGFDVRSGGRHNWPQFGLQTMRERAEAIGGRFSVRSSLGRGTHVTIRIPIKGAAEVPA